MKLYRILIDNPYNYFIVTKTYYYFIHLFSNALIIDITDHKLSFFKIDQQFLPSYKNSMELVLNNRNLVKEIPIEIFLTNKNYELRKLVTHIISNS